jgi:hypothetical protein
VYGEYRGAGGGPQVNSPLIPPTNFSTFPLTPRETPAASFHQSSSRPQTRPRYTNKRGNPRNSFSTTTTNKYHAMAQQASDLDFPARMSSEEERVRYSSIY